MRGISTPWGMAHLRASYAQAIFDAVREIIPFRQAVKIALDAVWGLMTMVIILRFSGGMEGGMNLARNVALKAGALSVTR